MPLRPGGARAHLFPGHPRSGPQRPRGAGRAVNRYAETAQEIPLQQAYSFRASPMDGTLRNMLSRWAKDSKLSLSYLHPSDFTLYAPVARIDTYDLQQAAAQLTAAYAAQRVQVTHSGNQIIVSLADVPASGDPSLPSP
ncbi:MAG: hypothetical protein EOP91_15075 [Lysobacteraceae bacterium]|nr:MAG: hypothetical protein EOP91_15075 [Xanthomonadaceae bacterium]